MSHVDPLHETSTGRFVAVGAAMTLVKEFSLLSCMAAVAALDTRNPTIKSTTSKKPLLSEGIFGLQRKIGTEF